MVAQKKKRCEDQLEHPGDQEFSKMEEPNSFDASYKPVKVDVTTLTQLSNSKCDFMNLKRNN